MAKTKTTTKTKADEVFKIDRATKRCIDGTHGTYSLFTFTRPSDEVYHFVRAGVERDEAEAWLVDEPNVVDGTKRYVPTSQEQLDVELDALMALAEQAGLSKANAWVTRRRSHGGRTRG